MVFFSGDDIATAEYVTTKSQKIAHNKTQGKGVSLPAELTGRLVNSVDRHWVDAVWWHRLWFATLLNAATLLTPSAWSF